MDIEPFICNTGGKLSEEGKKKRENAGTESRSIFEGLNGTSDKHVTGSRLTVVGAWLV
jgi:hypothetical protein